MTYVVAYIATLLIFVAVDLIWLGVVAKGFYRTELAPLIADNFNMRAALAFYLIYPIGVVYFALLPAFASGAWADAAVAGALFGFFAYATYDLTNLATLRAWPLRLTLVDMVWGTILTAAAATGGYLSARALIF